MKSVSIASVLMLIAGSAVADPNNPNDMEKYIQQCPNALVERKSMDEVNTRLQTVLKTPKTGDENQDTINMCKSYAIMKDEFIPGLTRYIDDIDQCSRNGFPILKMTVINGRSQIQLIQSKMGMLRQVCN